jgi:hypothetical protein
MQRPGEDEPQAQPTRPDEQRATPAAGRLRPEAVEALARWENEGGSPGFAATPTAAG